MKELTCSFFHNFVGRQLMDLAEHWEDEQTILNEGIHTHVRNSNVKSVDCPLTISRLQIQSADSRPTAQTQSLCQQRRQN